MSQPVSVAVIGVGLVGGAFLRQLALPALAPHFRLVYLSSSTRSVFNAAGTQLSALASATDAPSIDALLTRLAPLATTGKVVLVDNTSAQAVANAYPRFLKAGVSVITPNKKAFSGDLGLYEEIVQAQTDGKSRALGEATVGAGLPVVQTLKDIVATGDKVIRIEGVLSGTLSYIFNTFSPPSSSSSSSSSSDLPSFSQTVRVAREKGYTEPHPGDDLDGSDVARKLTILSRIVPELADVLPQGYASVDVQSLVPKGLEGCKTGDEFLEKLVAHDAEYAKLREEAAKEGMVLRYVGVIDVERRVVKASLEKYPATHPFATSLGGSDNILSFTTQRYSPRPLLVQGAGAGADVTAMGVMGDLLKLVG